MSAFLRLKQFAQVVKIGLQLPGLNDTDENVPKTNRVMVRSAARLLNVASKFKVDGADEYRHERLYQEMRASLSTTHPDVVTHDFVILDGRSMAQVVSNEQLDAAIASCKDSYGAWLAYDMTKNAAKPRAAIPPILRPASGATTVKADDDMAPIDKIKSKIAEDVGACVVGLNDEHKIRAAIGNVLHTHEHDLVSLGLANPFTIASMIATDLTATIGKVRAHIEKRPSEDRARGYTAHLLRNKTWSALQHQIDAEHSPLPMGGPKLCHDAILGDISKNIASKYSTPSPHPKIIPLTIQDAPFSLKEKSTTTTTMDGRCDLKQRGFAPIQCDSCQKEGHTRNHHRHNNRVLVVGDKCSTCGKIGCRRCNKTRSVESNLSAASAALSSSSSIQTHRGRDHRRNHHHHSLLFGSDSTAAPVPTGAMYYDSGEEDQPVHSDARLQSDSSPVGHCRSHSSSRSPSPIAGRRSGRSSPSMSTSSSSPKSRRIAGHMRDHDHSDSSSSSSHRKRHTASAIANHISDSSSSEDSSYSSDSSCSSDKKTKKHRKQKDKKKKKDKKAKKEKKKKALKPKTRAPELSVLEVRSQLAARVSDDRNQPASLLSRATGHHAVPDMSYAVVSLRNNLHDDAGMFFDPITIVDVVSDPKDATAPPSKVEICKIAYGHHARFYLKGGMHQMEVQDKTGAVLMSDKVPLQCNHAYAGWLAHWHGHHIMLMRTPRLSTLMYGNMVKSKTVNVRAANQPELKISLVNPSTKQEYPLGNSYAEVPIAANVVRVRRGTCTADHADKPLNLKEGMPYSVGAGIRSQRVWADSMLDSEHVPQSADAGFSFLPNTQ